MTVMPARSSLNAESWEDLYDFLDPDRPDKPGPDRDAAAEARCLEVRRKLVCFFAARGCSEAEDLAVDTLLRVAGKCRDVDCRGFAERTGYFYGVGRNVLHEWQRHAASDAGGRESFQAEFLRLPIPDPRAWADKELAHRYLALCLAALTGRSKALILSYYQEERGAKIEHHKALAGEFGKSVNSLRIEVHRIRKAVRECLFDRLRGEAKAPAGEGARYSAGGPDA
jgi:DNA-directed RNA polymerase specialized sigma24 family protein